VLTPTPSWRRRADGRGESTGPIDMTEELDVPTFLRKQAD
jgi:hypothetical protein